VLLNQENREQCPFPEMSDCQLVDDWAGSYSKISCLFCANSMVALEANEGFEAMGMEVWGLNPQTSSKQVHMHIVV